MRRVAYGFCLIAMLGLLAYMNAVTLPMIQQAAQGLPPFDLRPLGYDEAAARAFLAVLSPEGRAIYLGLQHGLDTAYPPLLALVLIWTYLALLPHPWSWVASGVAGLAACADLIENRAVRGLLLADSPTGREIGLASAASLAKTALVTTALALLCLTLALALWRKLRRA